MAPQRARRDAPVYVLLGTLLLEAAGYADPCESGEAVPFPGNHGVWGEVLAAHVSYGTLAGINSTLVDYAAIRADPSKLRSYLASLCDADLDSMSGDERLALWLNAYNSVMVMMIVHFSPSQSVLQIADLVDESEVWYHKFATVAGMKVSLDDIEHVQIRGRGSGWSAAATQASTRAEGRVHAGMVCASLSCPDLPPVPFEGATLQEQLDLRAQEWLANPTKNAGPTGGGLLLNKVFEWFYADFVREAGSVHDFLDAHAPAAWDVTGGEPITYMPYNWALNDLGGTGEYEAEGEPAWHELVAVQIALGVGALILLCVACGIVFACCVRRRQASKSAQAP